MDNNLSTLICLFHHRDQAHAALQDILIAGIPESNVTLIGDTGSQIEASRSSLAELNVPQKDLSHLLEGLSNGGAVLTVSAISEHADKVEAIFRDHKAGKIDEAVVDDDRSGSALPYTANQVAAASADTRIDDDSLVPGAYAPQGGVVVYRVHGVNRAAEPFDATDPLTQDADVDPRELGLDPRMAPAKSEIL